MDVRLVIIQSVHSEKENNMNRIQLEEAETILYQSLKPIEKEESSLMESMDRILAEPLVSALDQPPFPRSAMDGYAVRSADTKAATMESVRKLKVVGQVFAGMTFHRTLQEGEVVRIMTGAPIPDGADCVIKQEDTDLGIEKVAIYKEGQIGENYCPIGEDFYKGELLAKAGCKVDAALLASAAAAGVTTLMTYRAIKAVVLTTGDELVKPGEALSPGKIYDSNYIYFIQRLKKMGVQVIASDVVKDSKSEIKEKIEQYEKEADLIITTGGVSVGQKDYLQEVMEELQAKILFHGIQVKPGMPTMFSIYHDTAVLSLSGNPFSAVAMFEYFMPTICQAMTGRKMEKDRRMVRMKGEFRKRKGVRRLIRGICKFDQVSAPPEQRNGIVKSGIGSNCLIDIGAQGEGIKDGEMVSVIMIES